MGCVNKSSKEFKNLAARNNVESNALELIVHKYWMETGNETLFPTDIYIQAQLGNGQYQEDGKNVRKLWEKRYSSNKEFSTLAEVQSAIGEASRFFPKSAIRYYKNAKGNFVLSVKKPVKAIKNDRKDFFSKYDKMASIDGRKIELDIKENQVYGIGKVQELYNKLNTDRTSQALANKVFDIARDLGINISFTNDLSSTKLGSYNNTDHSIKYRKDFLEGSMRGDLKAPLLLHEVLHALSSYALSEQTEGWKRPKALEKFRTEINSIYQDLKGNAALEGERGIANVKEFIAELSNPIFRAKLQEIDKANKATQKKSFWSRVLDAFKALLGLHVTDSYYQRSMNALDKALSAFDVDSYMRYNNIKNAFREELADEKPNRQYNQRISVIDNAAKSGEWTSTALKELNDLINDIENGKILDQRFPQEAARAHHQGGRANEVASLLLRAGESPSGENTRSFSEWQERNQREQPVQERIIENWAKTVGIWHDNLDAINGKNFLAEGGEAKVFYNSGEKNVTKILSTAYFGTPLFALDRITIHNTLFPSSPMKVIGFGRDSKGDFQFLVEQPFIQGEPATQEEIDRFITKMGFTKSNKDNGHTFVSDDLYLSDLHDENVIKTPKGDLIVIDADLRLNTPELGMGGKYNINDSIISTKESALKEFTKTLSPKQLEEEKHLIKQEEDDYDLVNGIEEEQKKSGKAVSTDFTFNDGITIKAPFMPNEQQIDALNAMSDFIKSRDTSMTLSGYAGTGKTSLMEMLAKKCMRQGKPVMFCASTNKAAAVLNDRVSKAGFKASTLNKVFGISVEIDPNSKSYNARNLVNNLKEVNIMPGTTIIIDEASMINEENYRILNRIADENNLKIIYVGDEAQLAPVNEDKVSKVFRNGDGKVVRLTQVERTDDNAILKEATALRNGQPLSGETSFNSKGEGVAYISPEHKETINEVIGHYVKGLRKDPNYFRILAYANKVVASYNNKVRSLLGYDSPIPQVGEPMTGYNNWGYDYRTRSYRLVNSESYKVISTEKPKTVSTKLENGTEVTMEVIPITLEDSMGNRDTFDFMDILGNPQNRQAAVILANEKKMLWDKARKVHNKDAKVKIYQRINDLDKFLFVNDNIIDEKNNYLQTKTIDFGYAMTVHKSQGSTFTNVLMDDVDISKSAWKNDNGTAVGEADLSEENLNDPSKATINSEEDIDLGDLGNVEDNTPSVAKDSQTVNLRQQLEYVGVSRATDTVTIISNNIKKEGSPLHNKVKENTIRENDNRSNNVNNNNNNETEYKATDEFRRVQEAVRESSKAAPRGRSVFEGYLTPDQRQRLANVLGRQLGSIDSFIHGSSRNVTNEKYSTSFKVHSEVEPQLFHDIFEVVRYYTKNAELVDLHDDYSDCKCFLTEDGTAGFAIEPDGNFISAFNLGINHGFLLAIKDLVREVGATHLDAYASSKQNLEQMYQKTLGFHTAATMDYNIEYDHDDIAKNHGDPQVVFMVDHEVENPKHFDKDSYNDAKEYQMEQLREENPATNPSFEEGRQIKVSLPSYEYFNDLYEDSTIDAEWKIPYLKELDAQLSNEKSEEENQNILNQMDNIIQSTSKEEYLQDVNNSKTNKVARKLTEYEKLNKQLDNLLEGGNEDYEEVGAKLPATEVRHVAELIMNSISDEITKLQTEEGRAKELFPTLNTNLDFQTATRREIVEAVGINRLIDRAKALFDPMNNKENPYYDDTDVILQADLICKNWDALMRMGTDVFAFNEGFGISKDYSSGRFNTSDDAKLDYDNFNDYSNDPEAAAEESEKDEQEKWQIDVKTVDVLNSMSALVRQGIHECYQLDENGNKVMSKWGIEERVDPREAVNSILRWTQGALTLDEMIKKLTDKQPKNPWLSQLITRLSDKSGKETDFQSQFFGVFEKHFQLYSIVLLEDGKYHSMPVNSHPALTDVVRSITSQYKINEHPLFNNGKINAKLLGTKETSGKADSFNLHKALTELRNITTRLNHGETLNEEMTKEATKNIMETCKALGFSDVTESLLSDVINAENIKKETEYLGYIVNSLDKALEAQRNGKLNNYEPFGFKKLHSIDGSLKNFLTPITDKLEDTAVNAFYDSGKMYQSYVTPSFMSKLMNKFKLEGKEFEDFMMEEYGSSEWFAFNKNGIYDDIQWRNEWLRLLARNESAKKVFSHQVELNFNKHNYMRNMTDAEYTLSLITQYFGESTQTGSNMTPAWFRIPMQSNKPSSDFIRFYSDRSMDYKDNIVRQLHNMFLQELSRIQTVTMRNLTKKDAGFIKNFDSNGKKFNFLPMLNAYLEDSAANKAKKEMLHNGVWYDAERLSELQQKEDVWKKGAAKYNAWEDEYISQQEDEEILYDKDKDPVVIGERAKLKALQLSLEEGEELSNLKSLKKADERKLSTEEDDRFASLLRKKIAGEEALTDREEVQLGNLADKIIYQYMENRMQSILNKWESNGILESAKSIKGIYPSELNDEEGARWVRGQVENFLWNDALASKNILQLTIGDIAFYKDTEDLQKRLAQLHAPGIRGNIYATDYKGNRVSDGKYRTFILKDFDTFKSNIIANISEVFDRKIAAAADNQKAQMVALKESLVGKDGKYTKINVTDAQGYSSPASYRKKAFIFGRWSRDAEKTYEKIKSGDYTLTDFEQAFQPLKPFVYTKLSKDMGVEDAPIHNMKVPFQAKNAEYLLIMADAILQNEKLSRPNLLRAVYRVMEDSEKINPTMGIDTVQFESSIKSGLQGKMDIAQFMDMPNGEEAAYTYMINHIYKEAKDATDKRIYKDYDIDTFVHETSYENYCLQQEVPEHFKLHSQAHGSQIRMITPSDLDLYTTDENGNQIDNYYTWREPDGTVKKLRADEFRKEYEETIAANIEESINDLAVELHLGSIDKKERNMALSEILQKEIVASPRYGLDMMQACSVNENGDFRIPKGDPIQAKRIEQLINSVIKNRVNKQKIAGGPIVQVSNFGTSRQLHIRFNDKQGNLIPLEEDYSPSEHNGLSYKDYLKHNQGGIAYFEVFCPMWNDEIYEKFSNPDGTINIDAINAMDPEYLKMVSYRIPTEDKYSCAPMKVVGFMPREAGDAIMLPYELTEIDDSDFDVDKRYVMHKDIPVKTRKRGDIEKQLFTLACESYKKSHNGQTRNGWIKEQVKMFMDNPQKMKGTDKLMAALWKEYQKIAYYTEAPTSGRTYRDNKIIDMTYAVLTNEMTADKILNPGGFDAPKRMGYMVAAYKNPANNVKWEDLQKMSIDELKDLSYTDKDITYADTQIQFYKQNSAAASLIGVFAVNKVAHATLESNGINLCVSDICGDIPLSIAGHTFGKKVIVPDGEGNTVTKMMQEIDGKYDSQGTLIGKTLGSLVSASADAVKDPILNLMNVNMTTAGMLNTMLRCGMPFDDAALFLSQDIIEKLLSQFNRENLTNYVSLNSLIDKWLDSYREKNNINDSSAINKLPLDRDELVEGLTSNEHEETDYKVLLAYKKLKALTDAMRKPTYATRFNSISSAVGPLIIDNLIMEHRMEGFKEETMDGDTPFFSYDDRFDKWIPVDMDDIFTDHPILEQFAKTVNIAKGLFSDMPTGSTEFRKVLNELPKDISDKMYNDKKLLNDFSNFYQSYLLIQSGLINPADMRESITKFPREFVEKKYKEKYPNNALIQAIRLNVSRNNGNPYLQINLTGMDERQKEELRYAWVDLHKEDPELSQKLFNYSFFRAGIGFSPKTFMSLVPLYVKERLKNRNASYVDTYRNFPSVVPSLVKDQFIRNNWNNNKLVPWKGGKDTHYNVDLKNGQLTVYDETDKKNLGNTSYMKTSQNKVAYLWQYVGKYESGDLVYKKIKPLGNNGEYLEMDVGEISTPLSETLKTMENNDTSDITPVSSQETSVEEASAPVVSKTEEVRNLDALADLIQKQVPKLSHEEALAKANEIKNGNIWKYRKFLQNVFRQKNLELNEEEAIKEFEKYC